MKGTSLTRFAGCRLQQLSYDSPQDNRLVDYRFGGTPVRRDGVGCQPRRRDDGLGNVNSRRASCRRGSPYGHGKAEYFSSGVEGTLLFIAAVSIGVAAVDRLINPKPLEEISIGLAVSVAASSVNLGVALLMLRVGRKSNSITLEANAHHLLTDVWTSVGVVAGVGMVGLTGWQRLDPIVALVVAANIIWTGVGIVRRSVGGLMDTALPAEDQVAVQEILRRHRQAEGKFHALRTRQAGAQNSYRSTMLVPGDWTVQRGHQPLERIEDDFRHVVLESTVFTHLESLDDPASWDNETLDRGQNAAKPKD